MSEAAARIVEIPEFPTVTCGIIVFFLGAFLTRHVVFLRNYSIPDAGIRRACSCTFNMGRLFPV